MRKAAFVLLFLATVALAQPSRDQQKPLAFTHVVVIDATGSPELPDRTVVISKGHIAAIGETGKIRVPLDADVVDATGKFLIPGLWDMHVHWYDRDYLPLFVANGVTGIRIMWGSDDHHRWRQQIERAELVGPHMVIASAIIDGPKPFWPGSIFVASETEARQAVLKSKSDGADFIKVYSYLPRDAYFAIADQSKQAGIPFVGHVPMTVSALEASEAGQKSIEHLTGVLQVCSRHEEILMGRAQEEFAKRLADPNPAAFKGAKSILAQEADLLDNYDPEKAQNVFLSFKKNGTWQVPTLTVLRAYAYLDDPSFTQDPRIKYMPRSVRASWDPKDNPVMKDTSPQEIAFRKRAFEKDLLVVGEMHRLGVPMLAGTDVLNPYCFPGFSLHDELQWLVRAGMPPMSALQSATINPARFLGRQKEMGTIERGKIADLVLLDANPLADIGNTKKINAVVLGGKLYSRGSLDKMLAQVETLASRKSIAELLRKTIDSQGIESAIKQYHALRSSQPTTYDFGEGELNDLGYELLHDQKVKQAVEILKLNAEMYPNSFNAHDSLGEVFLADGQKGPAIQNYQKSLELNPKNTNASEMLKKLSDK
jgi:amidohydrolase family protein